VDLARRIRSTPDPAVPRTRSRLPVLAGVGAAAVGIALLLLSGPSAEDRALATAASRAQAEVRQLAAKRGQLEARSRELTGAVAPRHSYLDVLNEVSRLAGREIWLTQFSYDRGRPIVIRGNARTNAAVGRLAEGLRASPHMVNVSLGALTVAEISQTPVVQFTILGTLRDDVALEAPRRRQTRQAPRREPA
jgi:Tfp pilus assembly protein PilN